MTIKKKRIAWNKGKKLPEFSGEKHPNWKGDRAGYGAIHAWIRTVKGTPKHCIICKTTKGKFEWASKTRKYLRDIDEYFSLCISCHRKYDITEFTGQKISIANKGRKPPKSAFKKGFTPWNKGKSHPKVAGKNNPNWRGGKRETICIKCGVHFFVWKYMKDRKYCTMKCRKLLRQISSVNRKI